MLEPTETEEEEKFIIIHLGDCKREYGQEYTYTVSVVFSLDVPTLQYFPIAFCILLVINTSSILKAILVDGCVGNDE